MFNLSSSIATAASPHVTEDSLSRVTLVRLTVERLLALFTYLNKKLN
jgi:hypothetical protein